MQFGFIDTESASKNATTERWHTGVPSIAKAMYSATILVSWSPHGWSSFAVAFDHGEKQGNKERARQAKSIGHVRDSRVVPGLQIWSHCHGLNMCVCAFFVLGGGEANDRNMTEMTWQCGPMVGSRYLLPKKSVHNVPKLTLLH